MVDSCERAALPAELREALGDVLRPGGLALTDEVLAACGLRPGAVVADVGCGAGITASRLRERHMLSPIGIDASALLLASGRQRERTLPLVLAHAGRLPVAGSVFDAILAECSLSTMPDVDAALAEFRRVLKPGGRLAVTDLYVRDEGTWVLPMPGTCAGPLTRGQMERVLVRQRFDLLAWHDRSDALKVLAARLILVGIEAPAPYGMVLAAQAAALHKASRPAQVESKGPATTG